MNKIRSKKFLLLFLSLFFVIFGVYQVGVIDLYHSLFLFSSKTVLLVFVFLFINFFLVSFRLERLTKYLYGKLSFLTILKANIQGNFASLFVISLFGQVVGRHHVMTHYGISPVLVALMTAVERFVIAFVSILLCLSGIFLLFDISKVKDFLGTTTFTQFILVIVLAFFFSVAIGGSSYDIKLVRKFVTLKILNNFFKIIIITFFSQIFVLASFVIAAKTLSPQSTLITLFSAAAIISFAASLPISVNGWGIREVTAIFVFGHIGISEPHALAISILVGICSSLIVLLAFPFSLKIKGRNDKFNTGNKSIVNNTLSSNKISAWVLSISISMLIFFQFYIPVFGELINVNLADVFALLSLAVLVSSLFFNRKLPNWKLNKFNLFLIIISLLFVLAFFHGVFHIGVTQWALMGRVFGWLVLLGYMSLSIIVVSYLGSSGVRRTTEFLVITACIVIAVQLALRFLSLYEIINYTFYNFEGYSANRNAFSFQLIICSALLLNKSFFLVKESKIFYEKFSPFNRNNIFIFLHGIILFGIVLTGSKAGMITEFILLAVAYQSSLSDKYFLFKSIVSGLIVFIIFRLALSISIDTNVSFNNNIINFSSPSSAMEHWKTIIKGLDLWMNSPVIGIGLGTFIEKSPLWFDRPIVIHSTPVWILVEFGLVGAAVFFFIFSSVLYQAIRNINMTHSKLLIMLLLAFFVFGLFHEIFNQRIFWLSLGLCLALPLATYEKH